MTSASHGPVTLRRMAGLAGNRPFPAEPNIMMLADEAVLCGPVPLEAAASSCAQGRRESSGLVCGFDLTAARPAGPCVKKPLQHVPGPHRPGGEFCHRAGELLAAR